MSLRIAVLASHPVQYQACWYRALAASPGLDLEVLFCHRSTARDQAAAGFGVEFEWDTPLFEGYAYRFLKNNSKHPSASTTFGTNTPEIIGLLRENRYAAVIVLGWFFRSAWQAIRGAWSANIPVLVQGDSHLHTSRSFATSLVKTPIYRWAIPKFDACLAAGQWSRDYFAFYGASKERIFTVPHCVDDRIFSNPKEQSDLLRHIWRAQFGIPEDCCLFLFAGKFIPKKRPLDFVHALARAKQRGAAVVGVMVGDGELRSDSQALAKDISAPIHFAGFLNQSEIRRAYAGCDVLILPSDGGETWGLVINEAMSFGRPCIVSNFVGAGPDLITPDLTGDIFPLGNIEALAALIQKYSSNLAKTRNMQEGVARRIADFSLPVTVQRTRQAIEFALHSKKSTQLASYLST